MKNHFFSHVVGMIIPLWILTSCGQNPLEVTGATSYMEVENNETYLNIEVDIEFTQFQPMDVTLPIYVPRGGVVGEFSLRQDLNGHHNLDVQLNFSQISGIQATVGSLPNGSALPLIGNIPVLTLPFGQGKGEIYLALGPDAKAFGIAVPIAILDSVGANVGTTSLFPIFNIPPITGSAGLFSSRNSGENGFGIFVNIPEEVLSPFRAEFAKRSFLKPRKLNLRDVMPSRRKMKKIKRELEKAARRESTFLVH